MSFPGFAELAVILVIVLIAMGPGKLPQVFESLGVGIRKFREGAQTPLPDKDADATPPGGV